MVTHISSDELLQYANERQDQAVMASMVLVTASGGTPTDHPQSVDWSAGTCMHIEQKIGSFLHIVSYLLYFKSLYRLSHPVSSGCSWPEWAAIWTRLASSASSLKSDYVRKLWSWLWFSLDNTFSLSFAQSVKFTQTSFPHSHSLMPSCKHLDSWMQETEGAMRLCLPFKHACSTRNNHGDTGWIHSPQ